MHRCQWKGLRYIPRRLSTRRTRDVSPSIQIVPRKPGHNPMDQSGRETAGQIGGQACGMAFNGTGALSVRTMTTVSVSDVVLLAHAGFGVTGCLAAAWVVAETLNARAENAGRIRAVALLVAVTMAAAWICGGYWYVQFYPALVICRWRG